MSQKTVNVMKTKIVWTKKGFQSQKNNSPSKVNKILENMNKNYTKSTITKILKKGENQQKRQEFNKSCADQILLKRSHNYLF